MAGKSFSEINVNPWVAGLIVTGLILAIALYAKQSSEKLWEATCSESAVAQFPSPSGKESVLLKHNRCTTDEGSMALLMLPPKPSMLGGNGDAITFRFEDITRQRNSVPLVGVKWIDDNTIKVGTEAEVAVDKGDETNRSIMVILEQGLLEKTMKDSREYVNWRTLKGQHYKGMDELEASFSNLKKLKGEKTPVGDIELYYDPAISKVLSGKERSAGKLIKTRLDRTSGKQYIIGFSTGMSMDPGFSITRVDSSGEANIGGAAGTRMMIPGNGAIYVTGHTNDMVMTRAKYVLKNGKLRYIKQPFEYIGLVTKTLATVKLFGSRQYKTIVAILPRDRNIEVILRDGQNYLVKSPFGLIGWVRIKSGYQSPISGIYFAGD